MVAEPAQRRDPEFLTRDCKQPRSRMFPSLGLNTSKGETEMHHDHHLLRCPIVIAVLIGVRWMPIGKQLVGFSAIFP
jgi:hypothetical protein